MKSLTRHLTFTIPARMGFENITSTVAELVTESGIQEGLCLVNAMHITASVFINDDENGLHNDYKKWLEKLVPFDASPEVYDHNRTGEDNADAHKLRHHILWRTINKSLNIFRSCRNKPLASSTTSPRYVWSNETILCSQ